MLQLIQRENVEDWYRVGGHCLQFFATDEEVQRWLNTALPSEFAPYRLVVIESVKQGKYYIQVPHLWELSDFKPLVNKKNAPWKFYIMSEILSDGLVLREGSRVEALCIFNALVELQHGMRIAGQIWESSLSIVERLRRNDNPDIERNDEQYYKVYKSLRKAITKETIFTTISAGPDSDGFEINWLRMTEEAALEFKNGTPFTCGPGSRIEKSTRLRGRPKQP